MCTCVHVCTSEYMCTHTWSRGLVYVGGLRCEESGNERRRLSVKSMSIRSNGRETRNGSGLRVELEYGLFR